MSHALRPSTKASYVPCRTEWFIGDLTTVERLHTVTGRVAEGNHFNGATLVRHGGGFPPHRNAAFSSRAASASSAVASATSQPARAIRHPTVDNQALLSVVQCGTHACCRHDQPPEA